MNGSNTCASALGRSRPWLAIVAVLALPASGCMSSGASSFADGVSVTDRTGSVAATRQIPLNIAPTEDYGAVPVQPGASNGTARQVASAGDTAVSRPTPAPRIDAGYSQAAGETSDLQALAPMDEPLRPKADAQFASVAPASAGASEDLSRSPAFDSMNSGLADPTEAAAQARIPALYASIDHGECKGGWGPKPKMVNAMRMAPGDPYYMEMRLRHTPPLPVGHVYIAYGRLGPDGEPLDEKLVMLAPVGGYGGAAFAAAVPMPGVLKPYGDDCILRPIAAYRKSLTAVQFEQLLLEIERQKEKKPSYSLFAYNCNHFMSDVAKSVGILPPENIYTASLTYFYEMMDRNEGHKVARTPEELKLASAGRYPTQ